MRGLWKAQSDPTHHRVQYITGWHITSELRPAPLRRGGTSPWARCDLLEWLPERQPVALEIMDAELTQSPRLAERFALNIGAASNEF